MNIRWIQKQIPLAVLTADLPGRGSIGPSVVATVGMVVRGNKSRRVGIGKAKKEMVITVVKNLKVVAKIPRRIRNPIRDDVPTLTEV